MLIKMENGKIVVWGVYGNEGIKLDIPKSPRLLGVEKFFWALFGYRDNLFGAPYGRVTEEKDFHQVRFTLDELAEAAFGNYDPIKFADLLYSKIDLEDGQGEGLCNLIRNYENPNDSRRAAYFSQEMTSMQGGAAFFFSPLPCFSDWKEVLGSIPSSFRSSTRFKGMHIYPPRLQTDPHENSVVGRSPINFYRKTPEEFKDFLDSKGVIPYLTGSRHHLEDLNLDPFYLIRRFKEIDTSEYKIVRKE